MRISPAQAVGCVNQEGLDQSLGSKITHTFKSGTDKARPAITVVFEDPFSRHVELLLARERDQRCRLAGDRVLFPLFVRRYTSVDRRGLHRLSPSSSRRRRFEPDPEPECRKPVQAWQRAVDRMQTQVGRYVVFVAAQPCRRFAARKADTARLMTSLVVRSCLLA